MHLRDADSNDPVTVLFVYGTLRRGWNHPLARLLARRANYLGAARVAGRLFDLGRYPGLAPAQRDGEWVYGDLYDLAMAPWLLQRLDTYEGVRRMRGRPGEYLRVMTTAYPLPDGTPLKSWGYLLVKSLGGMRQLRCGDYFRKQRRRARRPL